MMERMVKVCGMREAQNIREVEALGIDLMGFIFFEKSPRAVREVPSYLPARAARVGVFVDSTTSAILDQAARWGLEYAQLHGHESPFQCTELRSRGLKVIKAFSIAGAQDLSRTEEYSQSCDFFLFDTKCESVGGSGKSFDWSLLQAYPGPVPFLLSGGIGPESAEALKAFSHPYLAGFDLNSRFETAPGVKNAEALQKFLETIDSQENE
jgi:Phosphoribosylanthranilate isomerase